ncbi:hypothetical protein [Saccharopolyspora cebuensis]|uniref:hypothetical protein n=1 Tax=Saccharopolyspora cebuensis TaxID=418759 RepID=UPI0031E63DDE
MASALEREYERIEDTFDRAEVLDRTAVEVSWQLPEQARKIQSVMRGMLEDVPPVTVVTASRLLNINRKTVAEWADRGLLIEVRTFDGRRRHFEPIRLHQVRHVVRQLHAAGQSRHLVDTIWYHLEDQTVLDREDLRTSLQQMHDGDVVQAY